MQERPTIKTIAEAAGVSTTVVSAVVNGKANQTVFVGPEKKALVCKLIKQMNYVPRKSARNLRSQKTDVIGAIFNSLSPYFASLLESLQHCAYRRKIEVLPYLTAGDPEREEEYLRQMSDGRVDGVLICAKSDATEALMDRFIAPPFRLKIVTNHPMGSKIASVHADERRAGRLALEHLIERGRMRLCCFGGEMGTQRFNGFISAAREQGLEPQMCVGRELGLSWVGHFDDAARLAAKWLDGEPNRNGVFCFNDEVAAGLLRVATERGLRVPQDLAIVGYDDSHICQYTTPPLTSINTNCDALSQTMVNKIMRLIDEQHIETHTSIEPRLVVRGSSASVHASIA